MGQPIEVMAFRKRLRSGGYSNPKIYRISGRDSYLVTAVEPLAGILISVELEPCQMNLMFR